MNAASSSTLYNLIALSNNHKSSLDLGQKKLFSTYVTVKVDQEIWIEKRVKNTRMMLCLSLVLCLVSCCFQYWKEKRSQSTKVEEKKLKVQINS